MRVAEVLLKYQEFLSAQGRRITREREITAYQICTTQRPFDSVQLCERLSKREGGRRISRSTVYRTLRDLQTCGLLRSVVLGDIPMYVLANRMSE